MKDVDLGKRVDREHLKTVLIDAAKEKGFRVKVEDLYEEGYRLGSVQETKEFLGTEITLTGRLFRAMTLRIPSGTHTFSSIDTFYLNEGGCYGHASKKTIRKYLEAVSARI